MKKLIYTLSISLALLTGNAFAQEKPQHEIYSMMVYNFIKYIQWPTNSNTGEFVIAVVGNDDMFATMNKWYNGSKLGNQTCVVKKFESADDLSKCQVVYIDKSKSNEFSEINAKVKSSNTLVVTDKPGLGAKGSGINFKVVDSKLKFELNQKALEASNLKVAGSLAAMAILI